MPVRVNSNWVPVCEITLLKVVCIFESSEALWSVNVSAKQLDVTVGKIPITYVLVESRSIEALVGPEVSSVVGVHS